MNSYSETEVFPGWALSLFERARIIVERLSDRDSQGRVLRCHEVARIAAAELEPFLAEGVSIVVRDGHYSYAEHSWLVLAVKNNSRYILDTYAVGQLPQVRLLIPDLHHATLYEPGKERTDIREDVVEAQRELLRGGDFYACMARIM